MSKTRKTLMGHQLFHFTTCPFCIVVRLGLWWMGLELPLRDIHTRPENRAELIAGGGKKQVPCLRIEHDDGAVQWMYESTDIIRYLRHRVEVMTPR